MLSIGQGKKLVSYARTIIEHHVKQLEIPNSPDDSFLEEKEGAFVTLHTYPDRNLRGCIGIPEPVMPLKNAIKEASISATHDPRFEPLRSNEITSIIIEVTVLTPPELLHIKHPEEYLNKVIVGKHGLIIRSGRYSGLLLPQVPVEQGWGVEEFLSQTCHKAWLPPDAWTNPQTKVFIFSGQIFTEVEPDGEVQEKPLA
jgi:uncharacterized protein